MRALQPKLWIFSTNYYLNLVFCFRFSANKMKRCWRRWATRKPRRGDRHDLAALELARLTVKSTFWADATNVLIGRFGSVDVSYGRHGGLHSTGLQQQVLRSACNLQMCMAWCLKILRYLLGNVTLFGFLLPCSGFAVQIHPIPGDMDSGRSDHLVLLICMHDLWRRRQRWRLLLFMHDLLCRGLNRWKFIKASFLAGAHSSLALWILLHALLGTLSFEWYNLYQVMSII